MLKRLVTVLLFLIIPMSAATQEEGAHKTVQIFTEPPKDIKYETIRHIKCEKIIIGPTDVTISDHIEAYFGLLGEALQRKAYSSNADALILMHIDYVPHVKSIRTSGRPPIFTEYYLQFKLVADAIAIKFNK